MSCYKSSFYSRYHFLLYNSSFFSAVIISNFVSAKNIPIFIVSSLLKYEACDYCNI